LNATSHCPLGRPLDGGEGDAMRPGLVLALAVFVGAPAAHLAVADEDSFMAVGSPTGFQRVRSDNALIANLVAEGSRRSRTFRQIVLAIEASDGIVYIEPGKCQDRAKGCLLHKLSAVGETRYLWIAMDLNDTAVNLSVLIAHELRHALEILSDASIRTDQQILSFYQPQGIPLHRSYETAAALAAGAAVRDELGKNAGKR
jgi:hypothetical protein